MANESGHGCTNSSLRCSPTSALEAKTMPEVSSAKGVGSTMSYGVRDFSIKSSEDAYTRIGRLKREEKKSVRLDDTKKEAVSRNSLAARVEAEQLGAEK
jgi:hypothetical protein